MVTAVNSKKCYNFSQCITFTDQPLYCSLYCPASTSACFTESSTLTGGIVMGRYPLLSYNVWHYCLMITRMNFWTSCVAVWEFHPSSNALPTYIMKLCEYIPWSGNNWLLKKLGWWINKINYMKIFLHK